MMEYVDDFIIFLVSIFVVLRSSPISDRNERGHSSYGAHPGGASRRAHL